MRWRRRLVLSRARQLRRIRDLRRLEEQQRAALLASGKKKLSEVDDAFEGLRDRQFAGRALIAESSRGGDLASRITGLEEIAYSQRKRGGLVLMKLQMQDLVEKLRQQYFSKRAERCQAELLLDSALEEIAMDAERKSQSALDEWHRTTNPASKPSRAIDES